MSCNLIKIDCIDLKALVEAFIASSFIASGKLAASLAELGATQPQFVYGFFY